MNQPAAPEDDLLPDDGLKDLSEEQRHKVEEFIEEEEGSFNRYKGWMAAFLTAVAVGTSAFHLYAAYGIVRTDLLRGVHVGLVLFLSFLMFPVARRFRHRLMWFDVILALLSVAVIVLDDRRRRRLHRPQHEPRAPGTSCSAWRSSCW